MQAARWWWPMGHDARAFFPARFRCDPSPERGCRSGRDECRRAVPGGAMSLTLVIDVGNSRMKWGLAGPHGWVTGGITPNSEIGTLSLRDWHSLPRPTRAVGVNVAGEAARVRVEAQLTRWRLAPDWLTASAAA